MFGILDKYLAVFLTGLVVTYLLTPWVRSLAVRFGVVDLPDARRPHQHPTARGGGLAVVVGMHAACLMAVAFPWPDLAGALDFAWWRGFFLASLVLLLVGVWDDVRGLKPWIKLGGQVAAALVIFASGTRFGQLLGYDLPLVLDGLLVVLWLVAVINAFNLIDGLDGLASGLGLLSAIGLAGILVMQHRPADVLILLGLAGACLAFLRYNFHPATIFLGDTGSMFLGLTLAVVSLETFTKDAFVISLTIPLLVLGVPIYDALLAIWRRSVRLWSDERGDGARHGIMQPDLEHLHHRLKQSGLSTQRVAVSLYVLNGGLVLVGLLLTFFRSHAVGIFLIALLAGMYVLMRHLAVIELQATGRAILKGLRRPTSSAFQALAYPAWDMCWLCGSLALIMWEVEGYAGQFWRTWFLELPVWVTPTFSLLAVSRVYVTHWPRARLRDVLMVLFWLLTGLLTSLGLALLVDPASAHQSFVRALLIAGISHPVIMLSRLGYRCIEELTIWLRRSEDLAPGSARVLIFGAGARAQLFLKDAAVRSIRVPDSRSIAGFIDEDAALRGLWVYGYRVLGGLKELPFIAQREKISRLIIVADVRPVTRQALEDLARELGLELSEWKSEEHLLLEASRPVTEPVPDSEPVLPVAAPAAALPASGS